MVTSGHTSGRGKSSGWRILGGWAALAGGLLLALWSVPLRGANPGDASAPTERARLAQLFQSKLSGQPPGTAERATDAFLDRLRANSPIVAEKLAQGRLDRGELESRVDHFLQTHPELAGRPSVPEKVDEQARVREILQQEGGSDGNSIAQQALTDRFLRRLAESSPTAREALRSGRMTTDELQSRLGVFVSDVNAPKAEATSAATPTFVDAFVAANYGRPDERAQAVIYKGTIEEGGRKKEFIAFKKSPAKLRIHIVEEGFVVGIFCTDGKVAWSQSSGESGARLLTGETADALAGDARFDDPLVNYRERGTVVQLEAQPEGSPLRVRLREADGTEIVSTVDPVTFNELSRSRRRPDGRREETRFGHFQKTGVLNVAREQEQWEEGRPHSITRIKEVRVDPGLLEDFFARPGLQSFDFMDYMNAAALARKPPGSSVATPAGGGER